MYGTCVYNVQATTQTRSHLWDIGLRRRLVPFMSGPLWGHPDGGAGASEDWSPQTRRHVPFVTFLTPSLAFFATCGLCNCRHSACSSMFHKEKKKYRDAETERQINAKMCLQMCMRYVRNHVHMLYPSALQNQLLYCRVRFFTTVTSNDFEWL